MNHRVRVKICGVGEVEDALEAVEAGADLLGFNFVPGSKRELDLECAQRVWDALGECSVERVALFRNAPRARVLEVIRTIEFDWLQFHGDESPEDIAGFDLPVIKALRGADEVAAARFPDATLLLDHPRHFGGVGAAWEWREARKLIEQGRRVILAGGLTPENVGEALRGLGGILPWAVDVASGVEGSGHRKDPNKMRAFVAAVRQVEESG